MQRLGKWMSLAAFCLLGTLQASGQTPQYAFRVTFKDKSGSTGTGTPGAFLSQRALDRRTAQGIAVDSIDRPVSPLYTDTVLSLTQGTLHVKSRWFNSIVVLLTDSTKILQLQGRPWVTDARLVGFFGDILHNRPASGGKQASELSGIPLPPLAKTTGSPGYYGNTWAQTDLVHGDYLHDMGFRGQNKLIAVLDAGFSEVNTHAGFDSLRSQNRIVDRYNFHRDTNRVFDYSFHGTQVLGTMAAVHPGSYVGSAPAASYALYVTEDEANEQPVEMDNMIAGMERADSIGADIIHASLGYNEFLGIAGFSYNFSQFDGKTTLVARAANIATMKGMLFVTTSGNEGDKAWQRVLTPGDADSALVVGSVNTSKTPAPSSGYGPNAAGVVKPDVTTLGNLAAVVDFNNAYSAASGTSYAAPQIAGWAACLWQSRGNVTPYRVRQAINQSAHLYKTPEAQNGYGVPDFGKAYEVLDVDNTLPASLSFVAVGPNPVDHHLWVNATLSQNASVGLSVSDVSGRVLLAEEHRLPAGHHRLDVHGVAALANGVYFVTVASEGYRRSFRILKN